MTPPMDDRRAARQKTIRTAVRCRGVGLHSGEPTTIVLHPAAIDFGIEFRRHRRNVTVAATWRNVAPSALCTTLARGGVSVGTVEHLMAAFAGLELDNVVVELDGPEVPAMDGSAAPFVNLLERTGLVTQNAPRRAIQVLKPIHVEEGGSAASLVPASAFSLSFSIDFASGAIRRQRITVVPDPTLFKRDISRARTFGFLEEVEQLRAAGLARGGSLDNAVVVSGDRVLNEGGLRYGDEFVRHKVLDAMGDLYLAGAPIIGHFHGQRSGHALNHRLLDALLSDPSAWRFTTLPHTAAPVWDVVPERASA
jgi:UDP-3-O-[3-hydroxymyristoyl] N-acetylglucosamine deacetylase